MRGRKNPFSHNTPHCSLPVSLTKPPGQWLHVVVPVCTCAKPIGHSLQSHKVDVEDVEDVEDGEDVEDVDIKDVMVLTKSLYD